MIRHSINIFTYETFANTVEEGNNYLIELKTPESTVANTFLDLVRKEKYYYQVPCALLHNI